MPCMRLLKRLLPHVCVPGLLSLHGNLGPPFCQMRSSRIVCPWCEVGTDRGTGMRGREHDRSTHTHKIHQEAAHARSKRPVNMSHHITCMHDTRMPMSFITSSPVIDPRANVGFKNGCMRSMRHAYASRCLHDVRDDACTAAECERMRIT